MYLVLFYVLCVLCFSEGLDKREVDGKPTKYRVPRPTVEAYPPKGVLVFIPDAPGIQSFSIEMNVNEEVDGKGKYDGEATKADEDGIWAVFVREAPVDVGDVIHLTVKVVKYGRTYRLKGLQSKVEKFIDEVEEEVVDEAPATAIARPRPEMSERPQVIDDKATTEEPCEQSLTTVNGKSVCTQRVVLDETFKHEYLFNSKKTMKDLLIAEMANSVLEPEESNFMVYTRDYEKAEIKNSTLILSPGFVTQIENDDDFTEDGFVKITNCTSDVVGACERQAYSWSIIPPILSARLTTKDVFTFRYGTIEIWAKLPSGNWIVPEIWLEQASGDYRQYNGRIFLAYALGNKKLKTENGFEIGYNTKRQGFQIGKSHPIFYNKTMSESETSDFHNYKLVWLPDSLSFYINDELMKQIKPNTFLNSNLKTSRIAPFDQEYYLTFGIHAGGRKDFPEGVTSGGKPKPWTNDDIKGLVDFWRSRTDWLHTWNHNSKLIVSKIKVTSL